MAIPKPSGGLTPKQQRFVDEYLVDLNATRAAIRAGYSVKSAEMLGYQLLQKTTVAAAVTQAQQKRSERTEITQDMVLKELARIGFVDMGDYVDYGPGGVILKASSEVDTRVVAEVSQTITKDGSTIRFKLHDKTGALVKVGQHLGMFVERQERGKPGEFSRPLDGVPDEDLGKMVQLIRGRKKSA